MSPAIIRSIVDLPQPEGPSSTRNSRSGISAVKSRITARAAEALGHVGEAEGGHRDYPFTEPAVRPLTIWRWTRRKKTMAGIVNTIAAENTVDSGRDELADER